MPSFQDLGGCQTIIIIQESLVVELLSLWGFESSRWFVMLNDDRAWWILQRNHVLKTCSKRRLMLCFHLTLLQRFFGFPLYMDLFTNNSKQSRFIQYCTQPSKFHVCFSSNLKPRTLIWRHWRLCWKSESLVIPLSSWSSQKNTSALVLSKKTALTWS